MFGTEENKYTNLVRYKVSVDCKLTPILFTIVYSLITSISRIEYEKSLHFTILPRTTHSLYPSTPVGYRKEMPSIVQTADTRVVDLNEHGGLGLSFSVVRRGVL